MPTSFIVRDALPHELDAIWALDRASFSHPWSRGAFVEAFAESKRSVVLAATPDEEHGTLCGFGVAWSVLDEGEIATLAVAEARRGQGLGAQIVNALRDRLLERGARTLFLEVRTGNGSARRLYARLGFSEVGLRRSYYTDGEDAVIMRWVAEE